ncbi:hypothetical protein SDJN03_18700, partial [Cucurbita argyrosperma subsp. sororia]
MHLESEPESESETESESEYNSSLYQSESASESPFKEDLAGFAADANNLWLQVALGFIPTPQCVARVIDPLQETMVPKERSDLSSRLRFRIHGIDLNEDTF